MASEEKMEREFITALKNKDAIKVSTIRMLKAEINNFKLDKNKKTLSDEEFLKIVQRQVKQHRDSIEQFKKGNREDLVTKETKELNILLAYLPQQLSQEDIKKMVGDVIKELNAATKKDMGKVMKAVMEKAKGRADGKAVSQIVSDALN
jgi:uncharacterized protein YqeY